MNKNIEEQKYWNRHDVWGNGGHDWSLKFGNTENLWNELLRDDVKQYCNGNGIEIAPGHGRITDFLLKECNSLSVVDLNAYPISECVKRFGSRINGYYVNDGKSLSMFNASCYDFVFSFDSFVHMHFDVVKSYLLEMKRVLKNEGIVFIHHSNLTGGEEESFHNIAGRANLNVDILNTFMYSIGYQLMSQNYVNISAEFTDLHDIITIAKINK